MLRERKSRIEKKYLLFIFIIQLPNGPHHNDGKRYTCDGKNIDIINITTIQVYFEPVLADTYTFKYSNTQSSCPWNQSLNKDSGWRVW